MAIHIFGDESGSVKGGNFLVGLVFFKGRDIADSERQLKEIKVRNKFYFRELHYSEINSHGHGVKVTTAKEIIDYFISAPNLIFKCTLVPAGIFNFRKWKDNLKFISDDEMSYNIIYSRTLQFHMNDDEKARSKVIIIDRKDKARPDEFSDHIRRTIPNVADFREVPSESYELLQLADLLLGCVNGTMSGTRDESKLEVIDHLMSALKISNIQERNQITRNKFRVSTWKKRAQP